MHQFLPNQNMHKNLCEKPMTTQHCTMFTFVSIYMGHPVWYVLQYIRSTYCIMCIVFIQIHAFHVVTCTLFVNCPVPNFSRNLSGIQQRMWNIAHLNNWMIYASPPFLTSTYVDSRWVFFEKKSSPRKKIQIQSCYF